MSDAPNFQRYALRDPTVEALQYDDRHREAGIDGWIIQNRFYLLGAPIPRVAARAEPAVQDSHGHTIVVKDGDWIIKVPTGGKRVVSRHDFDGIYYRERDEVTDLPPRRLL